MLVVFRVYRLVELDSLDRLFYRSDIVYITFMRIDVIKNAEVLVILKVELIFIHI